MIEYAQIMTPEELNNFFASISRNYDQRKSLAWDYLTQQKDKLVADYYKFEEQQVYAYYRAKERLLREKAAWDNKVCEGCGQKMKIVNLEYDSFWGCINFRDQAFKHSSFQMKYEEYFPERWGYLKVKIDAHWATHIIRQNNLQSYVNAGSLLDFYAESGLEDLREKYGYAKSRDTISGYIKAKRGSLAEEKEIASHLSVIFPKSNAQRGIRYKLKNEREKIAIVDLLLSNQQEVNIVEIKRSVSDINEQQLKLYHSLISFILKNNQDTRICKSIFIVYSSDPEFYYDPGCNYLLYEKIKGFRSQLVIQKFFDDYKIA